MTTEKNFYIAADFTDGGTNSAWQNTTFEFPAGTTISFTAIGAATRIYNTNTACANAGPGGGDPDNTAALVPDLNNGSAIARIGGGEPFLIGDRVTTTTAEGGTLELAFNDSIATDNKGGFFVGISYEAS